MQRILQKKQIMYCPTRHRSLKAGKNETKSVKKGIAFTALLFLLVFFTAISSNLNAVPADEIDWRWSTPPTFPNEAYGPRTDVNPDLIGDNHLFDAWVPDGDGPYPVMIYAHGGGFASGSKVKALGSMPKVAKDNVVFISINYTLKQGPTVAKRDTDDAIKYIKANHEKYKIDPEKIFLSGNSAGGIMMNHIIFNDKMPNVLGTWQAAYYKSQSADLSIDNLREVGIPIAISMSKLYPADTGHSPLAAVTLLEKNVAAGNSGMFIGGGGDQVWLNGKWIINANEGINTGESYPDMAEWIYSIIDQQTPTPTPPPTTSGIEFINIEPADTEKYSWSLGYKSDETIEYDTPADGTLKEGFRNPPQEARPQVWWHWMYGNITKEGITKDLEQLNELGISGVTQFHNAWVGRGSKARHTPKGPVRFMSPEYQELIQYAIKECDRLGMTMGLQICDGFSQTGGPWVTPEMGMRRIQCTVLAAKGGEILDYDLPEKTIRVLAYPGTLPEVENKNMMRGKKKMAAQKNELQISPQKRPIISPGEPFLSVTNIQADAIAPSDFVDLSSSINNRKKLNWKPPKGDWVVMVFYDVLHPKTNHPASPEGKGLEANKLNSQAIDVVFDNYVGKLIEQSGEFAGKTLRHVLIDSWECGYQSWTKDFTEEFKKRRGYDPTPYLPVLAKVPVNSIEESNRFLTDFRVTLDDLAVEEYYSHLAQRLNRKDMELHAEVLYGWHQMFGSPIRQYGVVDVPMNEIWSKKQFPGNRHRNFHGRAFTGYAATAGHVYGKPIIKDESFTVGGGSGDFRYLPAELKHMADFALCRGTNRFVMHTSTHQPGDEKPGWTHALNGVNFHRGNTWWPYAKGFIDYLSRTSYMMQQGVFFADVIRYVGHEDTYSEGYGELPLEDLPLGYRADHCDNTVLLEHMDVKDGKIILPSGASYSVLLLADKITMAPDIIKKLKKMVDKGATIIGPKPEHAPGLTNYPQSDKEVRKLADELWGQEKIRDISIDKQLKNMGIEPDFTYETPTGKSVINFTHRKLQDADIYFIATAGETVVMDCSFRITGKSPQWFDPMTGEIYDLLDFENKDGRTHIKIELEDAGSKIIVFKDKPVGKVAFSGSITKSLDINGVWTVNFEANRGAPDKIELKKLVSWSDHEDFGVQHFSGVGTYTKSISVPDDALINGKRVKLNLGEVKDLAEVIVNGNSAGILWRAPFQIDITDQVKSGKNKLEIKVINTWVNRLIGDKKVSEDKRICKIVPANPPWFNHKSKLHLSGLLGPVSLQVYQQTKANQLLPTNHKKVEWNYPPFPTVQFLSTSSGSIASVTNLF